MRAASFAIGCALAVLAAGLGVARSQATSSPFSVVVHADRSDRAWIEAQIASANTIFAPAEVAFRIVEVRPPLSPDARASVADRAARDRLGRAVELRGGEPRCVYVFLTEQLVDVDDPTRELSGVHWRVRTDRRTHYVILSKRARSSTLAHELGHYFGNPHSPTPNNVMSYARDGVTPPSFDAAQLARIRRYARRYARADRAPLGSPEGER